MHDMTPGPVASAKLRAGIERIKRDFIRKLDDDILDLEALRQMVVNGDRADQALAEIAQRAHKIRGVADTFGLMALGKAATQVDEAYSALQGTSRSGPPAANAAWPVMAPLVEALLDQMENALD